MSDINKDIAVLIEGLNAFGKAQKVRDENYNAAVAVLEARREKLDEREKVVANRENAIGQIQRLLATARAEKTAAIEREKPLADKLDSCRVEKGALQAQVTKIRTALQ